MLLHSTEQRTMLNQTPGSRPAAAALLALLPRHLLLNVAPVGHVSLASLLVPCSSNLLVSAAFHGFLVSILQALGLSFFFPVTLWLFQG